jgi:hypothetical protein
LSTNSNDHDALPTRSAIVRAAQAMRLLGDVRGFIHLIEAWRSAGEVPEDMQLAQVSALLDLCQTDRAWVRLKDLVEGSDPSDAALKLAARMFVQRGWPGRARKPLERVLTNAPKDEDALELLERASLPVFQLDEPPVSSTSVGLLLPLAEAHLSQGSRLKGQSLLKRLQRAHPENPRVEDLLWAMDTDWTLSAAQLSALIISSDTPAHPPFDDDDAEATVIGDEPQPVKMVPDEASDDDSDFAFPALFRGAIPEGQRAGTPISPPRASIFDDVTQSTNLADLGALNDAVGAARRAAGLIGGEEFTEIRRIIRSPNGTPEQESSVDATIPDDFVANTSFNAETPRHTGHNLDVDVEAEDDALIIITKHERDDDDLSLLELDPNTEAVAHPDAARFLAEAEELERKAYEEAEQERRRELRKSAIAAARNTSATSGLARIGLTPGWIAAILVLFLCVLGVMIFFALAVIGVL